MIVDHTSSDLVNVFVARVEHKPTAIDENLEARTTAPINITLKSSSPENYPLSYFILDNNTVGGTLNGKASDLVNSGFNGTAGNPPTLTYTPQPYYHGIDKFSFNVFDGTQESNSATVRIAVQLPYVKNQTISVGQVGKPTNINLTGSDDTLQIIIH